MKKIIATIAAFAMAFTLCSCGRSADSEPAAAQPSEVTTAATAETAADTAAVTTAPQSEPTTTTTFESETTTPENTTTAETTTTSDSTTAAEKQTTAAEKKTTTAKQTAAPKNTTTAKQTAAPKKTTTTPKKTTAKPATTTKQKWTRALSEDEYNKLSWEEQDGYMEWYYNNYWEEDRVIKLSDSETQKLKEQFINEMLVLINKERAKVGVQPVKLDTRLQKVAEIRADEILTLFDHERPNGKWCNTVLDDLGYEDELAYGENLGGGISAADAMNIFMSEPEGGSFEESGHRYNILSSSYQYVGIGVTIKVVQHCSLDDPNPEPVIDYTVCQSFGWEL